MRKKKLYCWCCGCKTIHRYTGTETLYDTPGMRAFSAILTFGLTEILAEPLWECSECGEIRND